MDVTKIATALAKKKKNDEGLSLTFSIGSLARMRRLELKKTLQQVASNICSVSYLSKIESNKIIPNPDCVAQLMERMEIPHYEQYLLENESDLMNESLQYFFMMDLDSYRLLYNRLFDIKNCVAFIIIVGYHILRGEYDKCKKYLEKTENMVLSLSNISLKVFSLYYAYYLVYVNDFEGANFLIEKIQDHGLGERFEVLLKEVGFIAHIREKRYIYVYKEFEALNNYYSKCEHYEKVKYLKILCMKALYDSGEYNEVINIGSKILLITNYVEDDEYNFIMGNAHLNLNHTLAAKDYLDRITPESPFFKKCLEAKCDMCSDEATFIEEIEALNKREPSFYYEYFLAKYKNVIQKEIFQTPSSGILESNLSFSGISGTLSPNTKSNELYGAILTFTEIFPSFSLYSTACFVPSRGFQSTGGLVSSK